MRVAVGRATGFLVGLMLLALVAGNAAGLLPAGGIAQAGQEADLLCDEDGVSVSYGLTGDLSSISSVTVSGIDSDCSGTVMLVRVQFDSEPLNFLVVPLSPGSRSFTISPARPVQALQGVTITIIGQDQEPPNKND